jgi:hypothetical protein
LLDEIVTPIPLGDNARDDNLMFSKVKSFAEVISNIASEKLEFIAVSPIVFE